MEAQLLEASLFDAWPGPYAALETLPDEAKESDEDAATDEDDEPGDLPGPGDGSDPGDLDDDEPPPPPPIARGGAWTLLRRVSFPIWLGPALATLAIGLYQINKPELWRDELASWSAATRSVPQLMALLGHVDTSSGAYYLFLHYWIAAFGASPTALRLPSTLAMGAAAGVIVLLGRRMFGTRAGVVAGFAFATLPAVSRYGQEARAYALVVLGTAVTLLLLLRALERSRWWRWVAFGFTFALTGALSLVSLVILPVYAAIALVACRRTRNWRLFTGFAVTCVLSLGPLQPLAAQAAGQTSVQIAWIAVPVPADLGKLWPTLMSSYALAYELPVLLALLIIGAVVRRVDRVQAGLTIALALVPVLLIYLISQGEQSYWLTRYMLFTLPAWALIAGAAIASLGRTATILGLVVLAVVSVPDQGAIRHASAHSRWEYPYGSAHTWIDYAGAAKIIEANHRSGDGLVPLPATATNGFLFDVGLRYYLPPGELGMPSALLGQSAVDAGTLGEVDTAAPAAPVGTQPRLWVVTLTGAQGPYLYFPLAMADQLRTNYFVVEKWNPSATVMVTLLVRYGLSRRAISIPTKAVKEGCPEGRGRSNCAQLPPRHHRVRDTVG